MKTTVILAHPWHGSFNKAIFDHTLDVLEKNGKDYQVIDLNKDNFNPVLEEKDLALFSKGETSDLQTQKYQKMLKDSDQLIIIFPIWWYDIPAILKGFIDKVMLKDFAYTEGKTGLTGLLTNIKKTTVISTSEYPTWYWKYVNTGLKKIFIKSTLGGIGLRNIKWINSGNTSTGKDELRIKFLKKVREVI